MVDCVSGYYFSFGRFNTLSAHTAAGINHEAGIRFYR